MKTCRLFTHHNNEVVFTLVKRAFCNCALFEEKGPDGFLLFFYKKPFNRIYYTIVVSGKCYNYETYSVVQIETSPNIYYKLTWAFLSFFIIMSVIICFSNGSFNFLPIIAVFIIAISFIEYNYLKKKIIEQITELTRSSMESE